MTTLTPIDTQVDLTINKLNEEAFNDLSAQDRLDQNQLYVVTENQYMVLGQGSGATIRDIYTEEIDTNLKSLILNRLTKDKFDELSSHSPDEIWFIQDSELSGQPIVVDTRPGPTKLSEFENDSGFITSADVADKRDYDDLTYGGTYDPADAEGYYGITSWNIAGVKYNGQTQPAFNTTAKFKNNPTYGTGWNDGSIVIHTSPSNPSDFSTLYLDGFGNAEPVSFTLSLDKTTYEVSFMGTEQQNLTLTANLANADRLALNSQLSAYATSAWVMNYVNDQISAALNAQL